MGRVLARLRAGAPFASCSCLRCWSAALGLPDAQSGVVLLLAEGCCCSAPVLLAAAAHGGLVLAAWWRGGGWAWSAPALPRCGLELTGRGGAAKGARIRWGMTTRACGGGGVGLGADSVFERRFRGNSSVAGGDGACWPGYPKHRTGCCAAFCTGARRSSSLGAPRDAPLLHKAATAPCYTSRAPSPVNWSWSCQEPSRAPLPGLAPAGRPLRPKSCLACALRARGAWRPPLTGHSWVARPPLPPLPIRCRWHAEPRHPASRGWGCKLDPISRHHLLSRTRTG